MGPACLLYYWKLSFFFWYGQWGAGTGMGKPSHRNLWYRFSQDRRQQRAHIVPAFAQLPSAQNNPYARGHILGWCILTSYSLICHPERNICWFFPWDWQNMLPALTSWGSFLPVQFVYRSRISDNLHRWTSILWSPNQDDTESHWWKVQSSGSITLSW